MDSKSRPRRKFNAASIVRSIDDWLDKERKLMVAHARLRQRFIRELVPTTVTTVDEAERRFEELLQGGRLKHKRRADAEFTGTILRSSVDHMHEKSAHITRSILGEYARSQWAVGETMPQHPISNVYEAYIQTHERRNEKSVANRSPSCPFSVSDSPLIVGLRERDSEIE